MTAITAGDQAAFNLLLERYMDVLYQYAWRLTQNAAKAEDLSQELWLTVWQQAKSYNAKKASVKTWLYRILHNKAVDSARKDRWLSFFGVTPATSGQIDEENFEPSHVNGMNDLADTQAGNPSSTEEHRQTQQQIDQAMDKLPPNQRAALMLKHSSGLSNQEVALVLGVGVRAVESLQSRGRRTLRQALEKSDAIGGGAK